MQPSRDRKRWPVAGVLLAAYGLFLALVAFWPVPVDRPLGSVIRSIGRRFDLLAYDRVEFLANVVLFIPVGALVAIGLPARRRYLALPIGVLTSGLIEGFQALALPERTPSLSDVLANTVGTGIGLLAVVSATAMARRQRAGPSR